ncbi:recombinase family protein [Telmatospirillum sp. J64-1]|uniref:recombinase family protein n=1 Tax=Telmatospirillum sp. J64-1 TaxID=2502183 RepID=UPI00163D436A|nr:recombinase family protein [Telmatospirillum sp. J64-1]
MLVALYARHSTDKQSRSTQDQVARLRQYCDSHGYTVADVFIDEAKSGSHLQNRRGIRRLLSVAVEDCFERIVTEDLSRISRDQGDIAAFFKKMSFLGITIETVTEGVVNELHIGLKGTMNALYLKDLADKTHRGMIASVLGGAVPGGQTYGYDVVHQLDERGEPIRGLRKINEEQARIVRRIFTDYASGKTLKAICAHLNAEAIEAPKGGQWAPTSLVGTLARKSGLLRQTLYKGIVTFNRMAYRKHPETGKRVSVLRPESEWIQVPIPELAIIDDELFEKVQAMLDERSSLREQRILTNKVLTPEEKAAQAAERQREWRARQLAKPRRALHTIISGRLYCKEHGAKITQVHTRVYNCPVKGCGSRNIKFEAIMPLAVKAALRVDESTIKAHFESEEVLAEQARHQAAIDELKPQIEALRLEVRNVIAALGQHNRTAEVRAYFEEKSMMIRRLKLTVENHRRQIERLSHPSRVEDVLKHYRNLLKRLQATPTDLEANMILRPIIQRITFESVWDASEERWRRDCSVELDYQKLLRLKEP